MGHKHGYEKSSVILEQEIIIPDETGMIKAES